jgi:hypothetical protein
MYNSKITFLYICGTHQFKNITILLKVSFK